MVKMTYRSQHQHRFLHFGKAVTGDAQNFTTTAHEIREEGNVTSINTHTVTFHCFVNFLGDGSSKMEEKKRII